MGIQAAKADAHISKARGFSATLVFDYNVFYASVRTDAWREKNRTFVTGRGEAYVVLREGLFGSACAFGKCIGLPPGDLRSPTVTAEFGTFTNDAFGFKGMIDYKLEKWGKTLISFRGGFYVDGYGNLGVGNVDSYQLATRSQVLEAQAIYAARARGEVVTASSPLDGQVDFTDSGDVLLSFPVDEPIMALDAEVPYTTTLRSDLLFAMIQPLTGTLSFALVTPEGSTIRSTTLPDNVAYQRDGADDLIQTTYVVAMAMPGVWRIRIGGDTENTDYAVMVAVNTPPLILSGVRMVNTDVPDLVRVDWRVQSGAPDVQVNIFANSGPLTHSLTITEPDGQVRTETVEVFGGMPLSVTLPSKTNGTLNQTLVDLAQLPTGRYHLWMEADDGRSPPARRQIATVQVDRAGTFPSGAMSTLEVGAATVTSWETSVSLLEDMSTSEVQVQWKPNSHPDVDGYRIRVRTFDPNVPTQTIAQEFQFGDVQAALLDMLEPGRTYWIAIGAEDVDMNRIAWSQETEITTTQPEFTLDVGSTVLVANLSAGALPDTLLNGAEDTVDIIVGEEKLIPLQLQLSDNLRYAVVVGADYDLLPEGINVSFDEEILTESGVVNMRVTAIREHAAGYYTLPIIGTSGTLVRYLSIVLNIQPAFSGVYLPLITR